MSNTSDLLQKLNLKGGVLFILFFLTKIKTGKKLDFLNETITLIIENMHFPNQSGLKDYRKSKQRRRLGVG